MLDLNHLRKFPEAAREALSRRGFELDLAAFQALDADKKSAQQETERLAGERNQLASEIAKAKKQGADASLLIAQGEDLRVGMEAAKVVSAAKEHALHQLIASLPNLPAASVPDGKSSDDNVVLRQIGEPRNCDFSLKSHDDLGAALRGLDFEAAAQMSGSRFAVARGPLARMHRALIQMMLDTHVDENGYEEVQVPYLVKAPALFGTGQLPKFEEDLFKLERDNLYLIPTAEVPVTNLIANATLPGDSLPMAFVCHTPCFRREAGSAGRDMKGLIRQHQFEKVELVRICEPSQAEQQFDELLAAAESILKKLELPYRVVALCAGDMGFSAEKTIDLEVWMPAQNAWREISSVSVFGSFQARRMKAKFKAEDGSSGFVCTLNGSGLAAGRALAAVMENYQRPDGSIEIPVALRPYMNNQELISPPEAPRARKPSI